MNAFIRGLVDERRRELASTGIERSDILSRMIKSSEEGGKFAMDDSELVRALLHPLERLIDAATRLATPSFCYLLAMVRFSCVVDVSQADMLE